MPTIHTPVPVVPLRDGTGIPQIGFGTLRVQPSRDASQANIDVTAEVVGLALQAGYRHIDTAQSYGTERGVGQAIAASGIPRDQLYVTSKLANSNHAPDDVRRSFDETMAGLGLDQLDLFLVHWPLPTLYDGDYVSTWKAVASLVAEGRLRTAGVSNFQPAHLDRIIAETGITPAVNQVELVQAEAGHGFVERAADVVRGVVAVGELAGDVHLVAGDAGAGDRQAHAALGAVGLGGVDVPVPGLQGQADDLGGHVDVGLRGVAARLHAQRAEADLRDSGPVPQRDHRDRVVDRRHCWLPCWCAVCW